MTEISVILGVERRLELMCMIQNHLTPHLHISHRFCMKCPQGRGSPHAALFSHPASGTQNILQAVQLSVGGAGCPE